MVDVVVTSTCVHLWVIITHTQTACSARCWQEGLSFYEVGIVLDIGGGVCVVRWSCLLVIFWGVDFDGVDFDGV